MSYKKKTQVMNQISSVSYWAAQKGTSSKDHIIVIIHKMLFSIELHKRDNSSLMYFKKSSKPLAKSDY